MIKEPLISHTQVDFIIKLPIETRQKVLKVAISWAKDE